MDLNVDYALVFKALGDATRLKTIEMLSCGKLCACDILESFDITQPTLSYHMKILIECGLVRSQKKGSWIRYSNNTELIENIKNYWNNITTEQENCICKDFKGEIDAINYNWCSSRRYFSSRKSQKKRREC